MVTRSVLEHRKQRARARRFQVRMADWYNNERMLGHYPPTATTWFPELYHILRQFGINPDRPPVNYYVPRQGLSDEENRELAQKARRRKSYQKQVMRDFGRYVSQRERAAIIPGFAGDMEQEVSNFETTIDEQEPGIIGPEGESEEQYEKRMREIEDMGKEPAVLRAKILIKNLGREKQGLPPLPVPPAPSKPSQMDQTGTHHAIKIDIPGLNPLSNHKHTVNKQED